MECKYVILDHPADLGVEAHGETLRMAFECAAVGVVSIIIDLSTVEPGESRAVSVSASDRDQLLVRFLSEILYLYDGQRFITTRVSIHRVGNTQLEATVWGERFCEGKHRTKLDVKAVTYHQLSISEDDNGVTVRVFLDI